MPQEELVVIILLLCLGKICMYLKYNNHRYRPGCLLVRPCPCIECFITCTNVTYSSGSGRGRIPIPKLVGLGLGMGSEHLSTKKYAATATMRVCICTQNKSNSIVNIDLLRSLFRILRLTVQFIPELLLLHQVLCIDSLIIIVVVAWSPCGL